MKWNRLGSACADIADIWQRLPGCCYNKRMQDEQVPVEPTTPEAEWQFTAEQDQTPSPSLPGETSVEAVSWTASEFIAHTKTAMWYVLLSVASIAAAALAFVMTRGDKLTTVVIVIAGILFGVMAARQPRELPYKIDSKGLQIGEKKFKYADFKSFSLVQEEGIEAIWLLPLQRFSPGLSIYFSPEDRDRILDILQDYLPVEQRQLDYIDKLMHKIRF